VRTVAVTRANAVTECDLGGRGLSAGVLENEVSEDSRELVSLGE
jgi:hypothetical protein